LEVIAGQTKWRKRSATSLRCRCRDSKGWPIPRYWSSTSTRSARPLQASPQRLRTPCPMWAVAFGPGAKPRRAKPACAALRRCRQIARRPLPWASAFPVTGSSKAGWRRSGTGFWFGVPRFRAGRHRKRNRRRVCRVGPAPRRELRSRTHRFTDVRSARIRYSGL
jgi:hypothetical protein